MVEATKRKYTTKRAIEFGEGVCEAEIRDVELVHAGVGRMAIPRWRVTCAVKGGVTDDGKAREWTSVTDVDLTPPFDRLRFLLDACDPDKTLIDRDSFSALRDGDRLRGKRVRCVTRTVKDDEAGALRLKSVIIRWLGPAEDSHSPRAGDGATP